MWVFKLIGYPTEVQNLLDHLDEVGNVNIYPHGKFVFGMASPEGGMINVPFETAQERAAFGAGVAQGVQYMGGQTAFLTQEQVDELAQMDSLATSSTNRKKMN